MTVTFCGHNDVYGDEKIRSWLETVIRQLISEGVTHFYCGGHGGFDRMLSSVLEQEKKRSPQIQRILVLAYLEKNHYEDDYDYTIYPELEKVPKRFAILKRNEIMVQDNDVLVAYVTHSWGGAAKTLEYAQKKKKRIILYPDLS
ncbi:MAG: hypothetical protein SNI70_11715 [Rikenellaceae bacterium]